MTSLTGRKTFLTGWKKGIAQVRKFAAESVIASDRAIRDEAFLMSRVINKSFVTKGFGVGWPRLAQLTLQLRRRASEIDPNATSTKGSKALFRTGQLRRSITVEKLSVQKYRVGVDKNAKSTSGKKLVDIAAVHEFGARISVTDKMRRWFMFLFIQGITTAPLSKSKTEIRIPKRPFLAPAIKKFTPGFTARFAKRYEAYITGKGRIRIKLV